SMERAMSQILARRPLWVLLTVFSATSAAAQGSPTIDQFMSPGFPEDLVSARKAERIAWLGTEPRMRNVFTAAAPDWKVVRLTTFLKDDGIVLSDLSISDDGAIVSFVRGSSPHRGVRVCHA